MAIGKQADSGIRARASTTRSARAGGLFHLAGRFCLVAGFALIAAFAYGIWSGVSDQQRHTAGWQRALTDAPPPEAPAAIPPVNLMQPVDGLVKVRQ